MGGSLPSLEFLYEINSFVQIFVIKPKCKYPQKSPTHVNIPHVNIPKNARKIPPPWLRNYENITQKTHGKTRENYIRSCCSRINKISVVYHINTILNNNKIDNNILIYQSLLSLAYIFLYYIGKNIIGSEIGTNAEIIIRKNLVEIRTRLVSLVEIGTRLVKSIRRLRHNHDDESQVVWLNLSLSTMVVIGVGTRVNVDLIMVVFWSKSVDKLALFLTEKNFVQGYDIDRADLLRPAYMSGRWKFKLETREMNDNREQNGAKMTTGVELCIRSWFRPLRCHIPLSCKEVKISISNINTSNYFKFRTKIKNLYMTQFLTAAKLFLDWTIRSGRPVGYVTTHEICITMLRYERSTKI